MQLDQPVLNIICKTLHCAAEEVVNPQPMEGGLTNSIFRFECRGKAYVYRRPGTESVRYISRPHEAAAQKMAQKLGLDPSAIDCDPETGWKISRYIENVPFDYNNPSHLATGIALIRQMHAVPGIQLGFPFAMPQKSAELKDLTPASYYAAYPRYNELKETVNTLQNRVLADGVPFEMCHNDVWGNNILLGKDRAYLIDWEFAGDNDPAADIASFILNVDLSPEKVDWIFEQYVTRPLTDAEKAHYYGVLGISSFVYFGLALYLESTGHDVGYYSALYYAYATEYSKKSLALYGKLG